MYNGYTKIEGKIMELSNISSSINNLQNTSSELTQKSVSAKEEINLNDSSVNISITNDITSNKLSGLAQHLESLNNDLSLIQIANSSLKKMDNLLEKAKELLNNNSQDSDNIKSTLLEVINTQETTSVKGENILSSYESGNTISIIIDGKEVTAIKPDITAQIRDTINKITAKDEKQASAIINTLSSAQSLVQNSQEQFSTMKDQVAQKATTDISKEISNTIEIAKSKIGDKITDFNKADLNGQMGSFIATQANATIYNATRLLV